METGPRIQSVFSQKLDRAVFATYFLGAVVPLLALALLAHRYVLPAFSTRISGRGGRFDELPRLRKAQPQAGVDTNSVVHR